MLLKNNKELGQILHIAIEIGSLSNRLRLDENL